MIPLAVKLTERGPTPRHLRTVYTKAKKKAYFEGAVFFHSTMSDARFTHVHARRAGYTPRKKRYTASKVSRYGHSRPLERTGRSRRMSRTARITSTSKGATVRYPGLRVFNFRHPNSQVNMVQEWTTVLPGEVGRVGEKIDRVMDRELKQDRSQRVTMIS